MTPIVEEQLRQALDELNTKVDRLMLALLGNDQFGEGRIPRYERRVDDLEDRVGALEEAHASEHIAKGVVLKLRHFVIAGLCGLPAFVHYSILVLRDLKVIH